ncbi:hypothetical protein DFP74_0817 [Nocardiopsis sp. Huas11]|uniref:hypothetical protein n=1 Tax=Nocardiopsis sp. Huas11 TaxID=2183912 RepID=UPI000EB0BEF4|nr:hypothetical protein [Nocardiopsis sp. Huas11]RKS05224.1 hypothetical protein DFP74_0817 [Nocardiopsis sp. Huas11]
MRARTSGRSKEALPPFPHEVELPAAFGDWYDIAAVHLGAAERRDSSWRRLVAGLSAALTVL